MFMLPLGACVSTETNVNSTHTLTSGQLAGQLDALYAWEQVISDVKVANQSRLNDMPVLIFAADASTYIKLINALATALPKAPARVLAAAHEAKVLEEVCNAPGLGYGKHDLGKYLEVTLHALKGANHEQRDACIVALESVRNSLQLSQRHQLDD